MTEEDQKKIIELVQQIQEIVPELDSFLYTGESIIISSMEYIEKVAKEAGLDDLEVLYVDEHGLLDWDGEDDDGYGNNGGGILQ